MSILRMIQLSTFSVAVAIIGVFGESLTSGYELGHDRVSEARPQFISPSVHLMLLPVDRPLLSEAKEKKDEKVEE